MTRTEERLRDALGAAAAQVRDDRLRPLPAPETTPETGPRRPGLRRHMGWLGPAAAAMSVLLIVALALAMAGQGHKSHKPTPSVSYPALPAGFPKYFAQITNSSQVPGPSQDDVVIWSTSTGAEVTRAPVPDIQGYRLTPQAVAAAPDGRTFYIAYQAVDLQKNTSQTWIYQLTFTHGGSSNYLAWIKGDPFPGSGLLANGGSMAVSPDGTRLAFTGATHQQDGQSWPDEISVVDLRTGAGSVWRVGLSRPGLTFTIPGISWTSDGRSLVFRAVWCHPMPNSDVCLDDPGRPGYRGAQVRSLDVGASGGTLDHGSTLRLSASARYPVIADAVAGPGGGLILAVLSGPADAATLTVERVDAAGKRLGVLYRSTAYGTVGLPASVTLTPDSTGHYLLLTYNSPNGLVSGWIDHGKLRLLPNEHPKPGLPITAW
jgi:WD40-like Beta Propeller Repeat